MDNENLVAQAETAINAPVERVWQALTDPSLIRKYMFGTTVDADWQPGGHIRWKGEWKGKAYEDKGEILQLVPNRVLQYSHFSPLSGLPDTKENYHTVTIRIQTLGDQTILSLEQDKNPNEKARQESQNNWQQMLNSLKKLLEEETG